MAARFQKNEHGITTEDIAAIAESFLQQLQQDQTRIADHDYLYVVEGMLEDIILRNVKGGLDDDPQIVESLNKIRSAVTDRKW